MKIIYTTFPFVLLAVDLQAQVSQTVNDVAQQVSVNLTFASSLN